MRGKTHRSAGYRSCRIRKGHCLNEATAVNRDHYFADALSERDDAAGGDPRVPSHSRGHCRGGSGGTVVAEDLAGAEYGRESGVSCSLGTVDDMAETLITTSITVSDVTPVVIAFCTEAT